MEIERKFLIDGFPSDLPLLKESEVEQGYLATAPVVRIRREKPLALYLFTRSQRIKERILRSCSFGGGCINDTIIHLATHHMGFGGVGQSGMGSYHGKRSFDTFSHYRAIVDKATWLDLPMRYHPYKKFNGKLIRMFIH